MTDQKGATAVIVAGSLLMIFGFVSVAVDLGSGFNERRQNQTAADLGAMAGAVNFVSGEADLADAVLTYVESNLTTTYATADWQQLWQNCTDPDRTGFGLGLEPVDAPWGGGTLDCISVSDSGYVRVRVPDQLLDTSFAPVIGVNQLATNAGAISQVLPSGGGILPFAVLGGVTDSHYCLRTDTGSQGGGNGNGNGNGNGGGGNSQAPDPCDGPQTGNFGTIDSPLTGNPAEEFQTTRVCSSTAQFRVLATNIALGLDHPVTLNSDYPNSSITDDCGNIGINSLYTDQGMGQGTGQGLVNGNSNDFESPVATPRLQQGPYANRSVAGNNLDNKPLWDFLLPQGTVLDPDVPVILDYGTNAPAECNPSTFDSGSFDWDGDGTVDSNRSWQHMKACLETYVTGQVTNGYVQIFRSTIDTTPRFAYVPQFWETDFPNGASAIRNIQRFRAVYLQGVWFGTGGNQSVFHPGEPGSGFSGNVRQVSGFLIPDAALPTPLRGDPPPFDGMNLYDTLLYR